MTNDATTRRTLDGRAVVVTGSGRGLGRAYARAAAAEGAAVVVNDIDALEATRVAGEIADAGGRAIANDGDVTDFAAAERLVDTCISSFGRLDGLVNNAGLLDTGPPWELTADRIQRLVDVNVRGVFHAGVAAMRVMREQRSGVIVNVTSGAHVGMPGLPLYGATKGAVASATYGWAIDLADSGVRVVGFSPLASTRMGDYPPGLPDPASVAPAVAFLLGDGSDGLSGQVVRFDGTKLSLLTPPHFRGPFIERDRWTVADVHDAIASELRTHLDTIGMAPPDLGT